MRRPVPALALWFALSPCLAAAQAPELPPILKVRNYLPHMTRHGAVAPGGRLRRRRDNQAAVLPAAESSPWRYRFPLTRTERKD